MTTYEKISKLLANTQVKMGLVLLLGAVVVAWYDVLIYVARADPVFNKGIPQDISLSQALLAFVCYLALLGIACLLFVSWQNENWIFSYLTKQNGIPDMGFDRFQHEPQFKVRDWAAFNQTCEEEIRKIKIELGEEAKPLPVVEKEQAPQAEGKEKEKSSTDKTNEPAQKSETETPRIGTTLPSLTNHASLPDDEIANLKQSLNKAKNRALRREVA